MVVLHLASWGNKEFYMMKISRYGKFIHSGLQTLKNYMEGYKFKK
jgi:hypothetical protein